jgi:hypothetical protein
MVPGGESSVVHEMEGAELNRFTSATNESTKDDNFLPEQKLVEEIFKLCFWYFIHVFLSNSNLCHVWIGERRRESLFLYCKLRKLQNVFISKLSVI